MESGLWPDVPLDITWLLCASLVPHFFTALGAACRPLHARLVNTHFQGQLPRLDALQLYLWLSS